MSVLASTQRAAKRSMAWCHAGIQTNLPFNLLPERCTNQSPTGRIAREVSTSCSADVTSTTFVRMRSRPIAVLFDLDGTLIDSIELILSSMRHAFSARGRPVPTDAEWLTGVGIPLRTMFARYAEDERDLAAFIATYREYQLVHHDRLVRCYDQVPETIDGLRHRGHPLAVVTSKSDWLAQRALQHVGLDHHFAAIVGCDSCSRHKPHPEPVLMALERLGYSPEEAVFVGDSVHDVEAGNGAGVISVGALWGPFTRELLAPSQPAHLLDRIGDLPKLLDQLSGSSLQPL